MVAKRGQPTCAFRRDKENTQPREIFFSRLRVLLSTLFLQFCP